MSYWENFKEPEEIAAIISQSFKEKKPLSLIRIGDGENRVFSWKTPFEFKEDEAWFQYAGVTLTEEIQRKLLFGIKSSTILGLEHKKGQVFRDLTEKIINHYKIKIDTVCRRDINILLWEKGLLFQLLKGKRAVLVGRCAQKAAHAFEKEGISIVDKIGFEGFDDIYRVLLELDYSPSFHVVLVAAGIPAVLLTPLIVNRFKQNALDIGHVIDHLANPSFQLQEERKDWFQKVKTFGGIPIGEYLVKEEGSKDYYILSQGKRYQIHSNQLLQSYSLKKEDAWKEVPSSLLGSIPLEKLLFSDGSLIQVKGEKKVYYVWYGVRHWIYRRKYLDKYFNEEKIIQIDPNDLEGLIEGEKIKKPHPKDRPFY